MDRIREFVSTDSAAIAKIAAAEPKIAQWSADAYAQLLSNGYFGWVAEEAEGRKVVGFIVVRLIPPEAEILNLAVDRENREQGFATSLLEVVLANLQKGNATRLHLEVRPSNTAAISFYQKHLFTLTGVRPNYYSQPAEAALLMARVLSEFPAGRGDQPT
ncbi:MAG TPA: ribosomal protein S18-alanine N-acetyltransferase [Candidatus Dormibacteraeota bacterium]|nr:ribosomal protein S18-alanine N-acetyltransferase [Candidatus Dormibacteraeota bacterium]